MTQVKLRAVTESISVSLPLGASQNQPSNYFQLVYEASGEVVPDGFYTLNQETRAKVCSVVNGQVRGAEWVDHSKALFLA